MITALLVLAFVLVLVVGGVVFYQMCTSGWMWLFHTLTGSLEAVGTLLVAILDAIAKVNE